MNLTGILVADEHPVARADLRRLLEAESEFRVVGEASDVATTLRLARRLKPDILLLDLALARRLELQVQGGLASVLYPTRIIITVTEAEKTQIIEAFRLRVNGILLKTSAPSAWFTSIRSVISCHYCIEGRSVALLVDAFHELLIQGNDTAPPRNYGLTRREIEIIAQIVDGRSNREAGYEFCICERTVKQHLTNIFNKLGVSNRVQLALFAVNNRLLQPSTSAAEGTELRAREEA